MVRRNLKCIYLWDRQKLEPIHSPRSLQRPRAWEGKTRNQPTSPTGGRDIDTRARTSCLSECTLAGSRSWEQSQDWAVPSPAWGADVLGTALNVCPGNTLSDCDWITEFLSFVLRFTYWCAGVGEIGGKTEKKVFHPLVHSQMGVTASAGPRWSQDPGASSQSPCEC